MGTQWSEKIRLAAQAIKPVRRTSQPIEIISFKQLTRGSGFGRTVQCAPGTVTVIQDTKSPRAESFREALLGKHQKPSMAIRIGIEELRRSEMYVVGANDFVWEAKSVSDLLRQAGAPIKKVAELLVHAGLGERVDSSPRSLDPGELKRLAILHSLFARSRLVVYDRPFSGIDPEIVRALAMQMVEAAVEHQRCLLVLGETSLPQSWSNHPAVSIVTPERKVTQTHHLAVKDSIDENKRLVELVRRLSTVTQAPTPSVTMGRSGIAAPADEGEIVTRPQMIFEAARGRPVEMLRCEVINNPNLPLAAKDDAETPAVMSRTPRSTTGAHRLLTEVHLVDRLRKAGPRRAFRLLFEAIFLPTPEMLEERRKRAQPVLSAILVLLVLTLLLIGTVAVLMDFSLT